MNIIKLNDAEKKELIGQFASGVVYGLVASIATTQTFTQAAIVTIIITALKTGSHYALKTIQPKQIREGKQFKKEHWTEKADKML
jgi:hypothetical protein